MEGEVEGEGRGGEREHCIHEQCSNEFEVLGKNVLALVMTVHGKKSPIKTSHKNR